MLLFTLAYDPNESCTFYSSKGITNMEEWSIRPRLPLLAQGLANAKMQFVGLSMLMRLVTTKVAPSVGYEMVEEEMEKTAFLLPHFSLKWLMRYPLFYSIYS